MENQGLEAAVAEAAAVCANNDACKAMDPSFSKSALVNRLKTQWNH